MPDLPQTAYLEDRIKAYRAETFFMRPDKRLTTIIQAIEFVNQRGFIFFWPIKDVVMPSLWAAVAGDRPVADEHDDPGHVTWGWKDSLLGKRRWYYGRILRKRNTIISLETAPYFYALTENYGDYEEDYLIQYEQGRMTQESRLVYEALLNEGPLDTLSLRKEAHLTGSQSNSPFNNAINSLMEDFKILPVGVSDAGAWHYAHIYDITARHLPEIVEKARFIQENQARIELASQYFKSVGAARRYDLHKLFRWTDNEVDKTLTSLEDAGVIQSGYQVFTNQTDWCLLKKLLA